LCTRGQQTLPLWLAHSDMLPGSLVLSQLCAHLQHHVGWMHMQGGLSAGSQFLLCVTCQGAGHTRHAHVQPAERATIVSMAMLQVYASSIPCLCKSEACRAVNG
jgi:hypothetical protein